MFFKITFKTETQRLTRWATNLRRTKNGTVTFVIVSAEGLTMPDESVKNIVIAQDADIVSIKPARMNLKYAELEVVPGKHPKYEIKQETTMPDIAYVPLRARPSVVDFRALSECKPKSGEAVLVMFNGKLGTSYLIGTWIVRPECEFVTDGSEVVNASDVTGWTLLYPRKY